MITEDYKNGFRQAVLCADSFWNNIELYYDNPIIRGLDPVAKRELKYAMSNWMNRCLDKAVRIENEG